jgi:ABC-type glycerol-3-phosphate transport system substrate-binding protein
MGVCLYIYFLKEITMKKNMMRLLAALLLVLPVLPVWSRGRSAQQAPAASGWPKVTIGFPGSDYARREAEGTWPTDIFNAFREKLQIDLTFMGWPDSQALDLAIAAGDLPDVVMVADKSYMTSLLAGNFIQPMDDYLHLAPNLVSASPLRIAASRRYYSNGDGKLYFITPQVGQDGPVKAMWNGMTIRWDYYKELGYPEVRTEDDFLNVVAAAVARHPTTPEGKKVYGVGTFSDGSLWGWWVRGFFYGFMNITDNYSLGYSMTEPGKIDRVVSNFTDYDSPVWRDIVYYRKANKMGIFDPDSLTMKWDDLNQKSSDGQIVAPNSQWLGGDLYNIQRAIDPNSMAQYMVLPVEGQYNFMNSTTNIGWNFYYGITRGAQNVESIMKIFDYLNTPDGARFAYCGPQGGLWDIVNGVPKIKPEAVALQVRGGDEWTVRGAGIWDGFIFISPRTRVSDGGMVNLWNDPELWQSSMTPAEKDFNSHYGVSYPAEAALNLIKQGKTWDRSGQLQDLLTLLPPLPQNIQRIDAACLDIMVRAIPRLVLATDDGEFESLKAQVQRDLQNANIQTSINWWMAAEKDVKDFLASVQ